MSVLYLEEKGFKKGTFLKQFKCSTFTNFYTIQTWEQRAFVHKVFSTYDKIFARRYEDQKAGDLNARLTKDYDKFDMVLQAFQYEKREREARPAFLQQFFDSTAGVIKTRAVRKWQTALLKTRQEFFQSWRRWNRCIPPLFQNDFVRSP